MNPLMISENFCGWFQFFSTVGVVGAGVAGVIYALNESVKAADLVLHPPKLAWPHKETVISSLDHARLVPK